MKYFIIIMSLCMSAQICASLYPRKDFPPPQQMPLSVFPPSLLLRVLGRLEESEKDKHDCSVLHVKSDSASAGNDQKDKESRPMPQLAAQQNLQSQGASPSTLAQVCVSSLKPEERVANSGEKTSNVAQTEQTSNSANTLIPALDLAPCVWCSDAYDSDGCSSWR